MVKSIPGFNGYSIDSETTDVFNSKGMKMSKYIDRYGYECVTLRCRPGVKKNKTVHSLMMETFFGKRRDDKQINHINGIKTDNRLSNLEYCSPSENLKHAYSMGLKNAVGENNGQSKLTEKSVREIKSLLGTISQSKIAKRYGIDQTTVSNINTGKLWSHVL